MCFHSAAWHVMVLRCMWEFAADYGEWGGGGGGGGGVKVSHISSTVTRTCINNYYFHCYLSEWTRTVHARILRQVRKLFCLLEWNVFFLRSFVCPFFQSSCSQFLSFFLSFFQFLAHSFFLSSFHFWTKYVKLCQSCTPLYLSSFQSIQSILFFIIN